MPFEPISIEEHNPHYCEHVVVLAKEAIVGVCKMKSPFRNGRDFFVSSTGIATPRIAVLLMNELPFGDHTKRTPFEGSAVQEVLQD